MSVELGPKRLCSPSIVSVPEPSRTTIASSQVCRWTGVPAPASMTCPQTSRFLRPCSGPAKVRWWRPGRLKALTEALSITGISRSSSRLNFRSFNSAAGRSNRRIQQVAKNDSAALPSGSIAKLQQKPKHRTIKGFGLFDIAEVSGVLDHRHACAQDAVHHCDRHCRRRQRILLTDHDMYRRSDRFEFQRARIIDGASDGLEVRLLVQGGHTRDQPFETSGTRRFAEQRLRHDWRDIPRFHSCEQRLLAQANELAALSAGQMVEARH